MKFGTIASLFLLAGSASACLPSTPIKKCFVSPKCGGNNKEFFNVEGASVQDCATNFGKGGGAGAALGGGSCTCKEPDGWVCASFTNLVQGGSNRFLSVDRFKTDEEGIEVGPALPSKRLTLKRPVFIWGDPHVLDWSGDTFDFHGQCSLVLLDAPDFAQGLGLLVHVQTKLRYDYSFIETAAIKVGEDILEIAGFGRYFVNGVGEAETPALGDFFFSQERKNEHDYEYKVDLGQGAYIAVKTHNDIVGISIWDGEEAFEGFFNSTGLMGSYETGALLARDGKTIMTDMNEFGQEWQVRDSEPKIFQDVDYYPQFPTECILPSEHAMEKRRLRENRSISQEAAEFACARYSDDAAKERCIYDVLAVGDLGMADAGPGAF